MVLMRLSKQALDVFAQAEDLCNRWGNGLVIAGI